MQYIGIDIGASFVKGALLDLEKASISSIIKYKSPNSINCANNRFEINPDEFEKIVTKIINKLLNVNKSIEGIVLCNQMHGMLLVNSKTEPVTNFIGWQDGRVDEIAFKNTSWLNLINKKLRNVDITNAGIKFRSGIMGSTLFWLKENGMLKKHKNAKALFLGDYIAAKLSNGSLSTHATNACGSGIFNVEKKDWDKKIINTLGIKESFLPKVVPTGTIVGFLNLKNKKIPVFVSVGDMQTALVGSLIGLGKQKEYGINIGTGSQISIVSKKFKAGNFDVRSYFDNKYLLTITHIPAGRALNTLVSFVGNIGEKVYGKKEDIWEKLINLASKIKYSEGLKVSISFFKGNATGEDSGEITNITESNFQIGNVIYEAFVNMAENYFNYFKQLGGKNSDTIIISGGFLKRTPLLVELINKFFYKNKVILSINQEETLAGLYIIGLVCCRRFTSVEKASRFIQKNKLSFK